MTAPLPSTPPKRDLAQQLRDAIRSSGLSQHKLAQLSGVASGSISRFLAGDRDLQLSGAGRIADVLKLRLVEVGRAVRRGRPAKLRPSVGDVLEIEPDPPGLPDPESHQ